MAVYSPVAAGGIVSFHTRSIAVGLQDRGRLCDSLGPSFRPSSPISFDIEAPGLSIGNLRSLPCILLSGLSSLKIFALVKQNASRFKNFQGENPDSNVRLYCIKIDKS